MILSSHPQPDPPKALINYLKQKLGLSEKAIQLGIRQASIEQAPLPIVLWTFGLITLEQFDRIIQWQDGQP